MESQKNIYKIFHPRIEALLVSIKDLSYFRCYNCKEVINVRLILFLYCLLPENVTSYSIVLTPCGAVTDYFHVWLLPVFQLGNFYCFHRLSTI